MRVFGIVLVVIGGFLLFLYTLLWFLEDYSRDRISMWPVFLWIFLIFIGILFLGKPKKRIHY